MGRGVAASGSTQSLNHWNSTMGTLSFIAFTESLRFISSNSNTHLPARGKGCFFIKMIKYHHKVGNHVIDFKGIVEVKSVKTSNTSLFDIFFYDELNNVHSWIDNQSSDQRDIILTDSVKILNYLKIADEIEAKLSKFNVSLF